MGYSHVLLYENGPRVTERELAEMKALLKPYVDAGYVTLIPWLVNQYNSPIGWAWEDLMYQV
jgi:hypothetical protein